MRWRSSEDTIIVEFPKEIRFLVMLRENCKNTRLQSWINANILVEFIVTEIDKGDWAMQESREDRKVMKMN